MISMASLKNGVLLKLLRDMKVGNNMLESDEKPVLLQIRSIVPVLEEGALWPNRGFFLKVSDSSHTLYVSLPDENNEMIFGNKLKLGQLIYVQKLEKAHPVPLLRGIVPVPGRRSCAGAPEDIVSSADLVEILEKSFTDSVVEKGVILERKVPEKTRGLSDSESSRRRNPMLGGRSRSVSSSKCSSKKSFDYERSFDDIFGRLPRSSSSSIDDDSDADSVVSSSTCISKRRSWNESDTLGARDIFHSAAKPSRSRSANVSPARSARYDSSDDNSSSKSRKRDVGLTKTLVSSSKSTMPASKLTNEKISLLSDKKNAETGISWSSLPSDVVKFGKEVVRQRDIALLAAADALQEACAAERLLSSLSTLSHFPSAQGDNLQQHVDKFFDFQDELTQTRLIMQSLTSINTESCNSTNSIKEALGIALERKKNATTWIKSAVALDLSPCTASRTTNPVITRKSSTLTGTCSTKPKGSCIIKSNGIVDNNIPLGLTTSEQPEWTRGSSLPAVAELAMSMQDECKKLFMSYVEKYVDEVERKSSSSNSHEMAGMMFKVKRVSDWLDMMMNVNNNKDVNRSDSGDDYLIEVEAYGRVRNKIYGLLLKHVERTTTAFQHLN